MTHAEFNHTIEILLPTIQRVCSDFFPSRSDAEDAVQETLLVLWQYCERMDASRNLQALTARVAKSCCVNMYRRRHSALYVAVEEAGFGKTVREIFSAERSPHEQLEAAELAAAMAEAMNRLQPRERTLFEMRQLEGLSTGEIVEQTGISNASVRSMLSVARRKLFNEIKRRLEQ